MVFAGGQSQLLHGGLVVDPLAAFFLLPPALAGLAAACGQLGRPSSGALPGLLAAALLLVLAGDARVAVLGIAVFALACSEWQPRLAALAGVFLLAGAFAVLSMGTAGAYGLLRLAPPEGARAAVVLVLTLLGVAPLAGWAPWHRPVLALAPSDLPVAVVAPAIGLYLAVRILADLCGPATPGWWGLPLPAGRRRLRRARRRGGVAGAGLSAGSSAGWPCSMAAGCWRGWAWRWSHGARTCCRWRHWRWAGRCCTSLNHTVFASLAALSAEAAAAGAGSHTLDRLGGLAARMPVVALGMLVAGLSLALLPPAAGFASVWMLLQALFAVPRIGGLPLQLVVAATVAALGLSPGFGAVATVRLGGMAFLGRPRTPRAAAAEDAGRPERGTILGLAALCGLLGCSPASPCG